MITGEIRAPDTARTNQHHQIILSVSFHSYGSARGIGFMAMGGGALSGFHAAGKMAYHHVIRFIIQSICHFTSV